MATMEDTTKTLISLRIPSDLLEKVDADAATNRRSRAFIIIDILEGNYTNGKRKPAPKKASAK